MIRKKEEWYKWNTVERGSFRHYIEYIKLEVKRMQKWSRALRKIKKSNASKN